MGTCSIIGTKRKRMEFTVLLELMEEFNLYVYIHRERYIYIYLLYI